jgi:Ala-tRNA(Pro) deacylase
MPCPKLLEYLEENNVGFELVEHPKAYAAKDVAFKAGIPGRMFAKTVLVKLDGKMAMAVLPAEDKVNFHLLREAARAETITLATENEFEEIFPDCELGAMPPFGNLYGMDVYVGGTLTRAESIAFNAGNHTEVMTLAYQDFERLVVPQVAWFTFRQVREMKGMA